MQDKIIIKGARQHNLKNINVTIPRNKMVVITGLSGSGKSSLAFDTIYAEGQRRYVESLSAYARQFLGQMDKPDVDSIEGLSPAISIDQKGTTRNPRSTVGTVTEIYDYFRLLFARIGHPHCPHCGKPIKRQTVEQIVDTLLAMQEKTRIVIMATLINGKKGEHVKVLDEVRRNGFVRVRIDGVIYDINEEIKITKTKKHTIDVIVDRLVIKPEIKNRLADSLETALKLGHGVVTVEIEHKREKKESLFSQNFACPDCNISFSEIEPRLFSFNSPYGACPECTGLGFCMEIDVELLVPDKSKSLRENAINTIGVGATMIAFVESVLQQRGLSVDMDVAWQDLSKESLDLILYGAGEEKFTVSYSNNYGEKRVFSSKFEGLIPMLHRRYKDSNSNYARDELEKCMSVRACPVCQGTRLKPETLSVLICGKNIDDVTRLTIEKCQQFFSNLTLNERDKHIAKQVLKEISARLGFLLNVGLDYLTLNRAAGSLSGGEAQRIRLATQIGSGLTGVLYILDEPSIGLHQRDNDKLLKTLSGLRDIGNTLIVVEHDADTMFAADEIIDIGPLAGSLGGELIAQGSVDEIIKCERSLTGQYLSGVRSVPVPQKRRKINKNRCLVVRGASENNLKNIDITLPLGVFTAVTGVSGSGKSSLVNEVLYKYLAKHTYGSKVTPGACMGIEGMDLIDKVIEVDQSPIGRTPRSNPATYTGLFDFIRELFSQTPEARMRGYTQGRFSFNIKGGRCEACAGDGILKIEMHFLPDVYVPCEVCCGLRYNRETLEVHYRGKTIADVLAMVVDEALEFFKNLPKLQKKLQVLHDVGLGYIKLGQSATTLSGGEAQRVKLATELAKRSTGKTIYILDEPTTGLHFADVHRLLEVLQRLVDNGDTVIVIEHNLDVIKSADYIIDLGPEGGERGGNLIACGTPEAIVKKRGSYTGQYLKKTLFV